MAVVLKFLRCKCVLIAVCLVYLLTACYVAFLLLKYKNVDENSFSEKEFAARTSPTYRRENENLDVINARTNKGPDNPVVVHIWGKAAIGLYLWEHVFGGSLRYADGGLVQTGNLTVDNILFKFSTGPGVVQGLVANDVEYLVLIVNGRDRDKIQFATNWLNYLSSLTALRGVGLVLLGNEACDNSWLIPYMRFHDGPVNVVFLVYDSPLIDNRFFYQWPLGVATYRKFPRLSSSMVNIESPRSHRCYFAGTIYPNSSREHLLRILRDEAYPTDCIVRPRFEWLPLETTESLTSYVEMLLDSELTLSPVGINAECYRVYEALSCGSVPVVENVMTRGACASSAKDDGPLRLLKKHGAPFIYVKDWARDLPEVLRLQRALSESEKVEQRRRVLDWYVQFSRTMRTQFVDTIKKRVISSAKSDQQVT